MAATNISRFGDLCRLCATKTSIEQGTNIFDSQVNYTRQIFKKIEACLPLHVSDSDGLPKLICDDCLYKTEMLYDFRERVLRTQTIFIELLKELGSIHLHDVTQQQTQQMKVDLPANLDHSDLMHAHSYDHLSHVNEIDLNHFGHRESMLIMPHNVSLDNIEFGPELAANGIGLDSNRYEMPYHEQQMIQEQYCLSDITLSDSDLPQSSHELSTSILEGSKGIDVHAEISKLDDAALIVNEKMLEMECCECNICGRTFNSGDSLQKHAAEHICECLHCSEVFPNEELLDEHQKKLHSNVVDQNHDQVDSDRDQNEDSAEEESKEKTAQKSNSNTCEICLKTYKNFRNLSDHMKKHAGVQPYKCSACGKAFWSKTGLAQHEAGHTGKFTYSCPTCGKGFQNTSYLNVHLKVHTTEKPYQCATCGASFKTKQALMNHTNRHLGVKPFECKECGKGFVTFSLLRSHQETHKGADNRKNRCPVCDKKFVSKSYLQTHIRIHTGERPFDCQICRKRFLTKLDLRAHSFVHSGEKSFVCEICGKAFARLDALKSHSRSHTGERPYKCEFCEQTFTQSSPLIVHKRRLHTGERPYECDKCDKKFVSKWTLSDHCRKQHKVSRSTD